MLRFDRRTAVAVALALAGTGPASAAVIRVGPGGDHATVQAAFDAAIATPEADELRIRAGTYLENVTLFGVDLGGGVVASGGWDAAFTTRNPDPAVTVIDAGGLGRAFHGGFRQTGNLTLRGLTFRNGAAPFGAGLYLYTRAPAVVIDRCRFVANQVSHDDGVQGAIGGGLLFGVLETGQATLVDSVITGNSAHLADTIGGAAGGGAYLVAQGTGTLRIRRTTVSDNTVSGGAVHRGAGLFLYTEGSGRLVIEDSTLTGNHGGPETSGTAFDTTLLNDSTLIARRLDVRSNRIDAADPSMQIRLRTDGTVDARLSDVLVARGGAGIVAETYSGGTFRIVNTTVTAHTGQGLYLSSTAPGAGSAANSIAWSNAGGNLVLLGNATGQANLVGVDPLFVDPAGGNYRLAAGSPALDNGNPNPLGGLSPLALGHAPRVFGAAPDRGAYERRALFGDGFEYGDASWWLVP